MNEALETLINAKADSVSTYTKTQVDTLLTDKANTDDVYSKNTMDAKLLEYATSDSVYSKQDINTMKQVNKANLAIVSTDGLAPLDIAAGQYVYFNDVMYMATEEILTGVQLVPNANIVINPIGVTNRIGDGLKNAVTQINGLAETVSNQSQQIVNLGNALAYVINGNTYSGATIPNGSYVLWNGVLYTANGAIPAGNVSEVNFTALSATGGLNSLAEDLIKIVSVPVTDLGALSAGASGYKTYDITIPDGYISTGISCIFKGHPGAGAGFNIQPNFPTGRTGTITEYYTYQAITSVPVNYSDFIMHFLCLKEM